MAAVAFCLMPGVIRDVEIITFSFEVKPAQQWK
jgi:hypothetical protein